jgi:hypothetical protein
LAGFRKVISESPLFQGSLLGINPLTGKLIMSLGRYSQLSVGDQAAVSSVMQQNKNAFETAGEMQLTDPQKQGLMDRLFDQEASGLSALTALIGTLGSLYFMYENNKREWKIYEQTRDEDRRQFNLLYQQRNQESATNAALARAQIDANSGGSGGTRSTGESYI